MLHRRTASKRIVIDGRILGEIDQVRETLRLAKIQEGINPQGLDGEVPRLERQLAELSAKAAEESLELVVGAIPAEEFDELLRQHPPTEAQLERYREQVKVAPWSEMPEMNPQSMGPALLEASLIEPKWSRQEIVDFWKGLSRGGQNQLWSFVLSVQVGGADLPFFNAATATTNGGGGSSTTSANEESPSRSSKVV